MLSKLSKTNFWPILIIITAISTGILSGSNAGGILRQMLVFWFILVCPGMAIIRLLHIKDPLAELVIAIALSLSISALLAEFMVMAHIWSPSIGLALLIITSLIGATLQIIYRPRASLIEE